MSHQTVSQMAKVGDRSKLNDRRNVYRALILAMRPLMAEYKEALAEVKHNKLKIAAPARFRSKKQRRLEQNELYLKIRDLRKAMTNVAQSCKDGMLAIAAYHEDLVDINFPFLKLFNLQHMCRSMHISRRGNTREKVAREIKARGLHVPLDVFFRTVTVSAKYSKAKVEMADIEAQLRVLVDKATVEASTSESKEEGEFDAGVDFETEEGFE